MDTLAAICLEEAVHIAPIDTGDPSRIKCMCLDTLVTLLISYTAVLLTWWAAIVDYTENFEKNKEAQKKDLQKKKELTLREVSPFYAFMVENFMFHRNDLQVLRIVMYNISFE